MYITRNRNTRCTKLSTAPPALALNLTPSWKPLTSYQNWRGSSAGNPTSCSGYSSSSHIYYPEHLSPYCGMRKPSWTMLQGYQLTRAWESDSAFDINSAIKTFNILLSATQFTTKILRTSLRTIWFRLWLFKIYVLQKIIFLMRPVNSTASCE